MRRRALFAACGLAALARACTDYTGEDPAVPVVPAEAGATPSADASPASSSTDAGGTSGEASAMPLIEAGMGGAGDAGDAGANCQTTDYRTPAIVTTSGIGIEWALPTGVQALGDPAASALMTTAKPDSKELDTSAYGFAIPANATIRGITVHLRGKSTESDDDERDLQVQLIGATGKATGGDKSAKIWHETYEVASYGGTTSTWEIMPTPAIVNDPKFGFAFRAHYGGGTNGTMFVDQISIAVTYCQ